MTILHQVTNTQESGTGKEKEIPQQRLLPQNSFATSQVRLLLAEHFVNNFSILPVGKNIYITYLRGTSRLADPIHHGDWGRLEKDLEASAAVVEASKFSQGFFLRAKTKEAVEEKSFLPSCKKL